MPNTIMFERLEQKRKEVENALRTTTDPNEIHAFNDLLDNLTIRLCQTA